MAEVTDDLPPIIVDELQKFVEKQQIKLQMMENLLGTPDRGIEVAKFMKTTIAEFMRFNLAERTLILQFIKDSETAIQSVMVAMDKCAPMQEVQPGLDLLMKRTDQLTELYFKKKEGV